MSKETIGQTPTSLMGMPETRSQPQSPETETTTKVKFLKLSPLDIQFALLKTEKDMEEFNKFAQTASSVDLSALDIPSNY